MDHDELIEEFAREHRYRVVLVVAAIIGIVASAVVGVAFALGGIDAGGATGIRNPAGLVFFVVPFAAAMVLGGGIYHGLRFIGRHRARRTKHL